MQKRLAKRPTHLLAAVLALALGTGSAGPVRAQGIPTNIRVSHDHYPMHVEPFLAINPRNHRNFLAVSQLIGHDQSDTLGTFVSFDGGRTWHDNGPIRLPPGRDWGTDVTVTFDTHGVGFVCATAIGGSGRNTRGIYVWRTDDGGRSFHPPVAVVQGSDLDHPWIASDQSRPGVLYVVWGSSTGLGFSRSLDGGRVFSRPRDINGGITSQVPALAAGPHGSVYATYEAGNGGHTNVVEIVSSRDRGLHFGAPHALGTMPPEITVNGRLSLPTSPAVAVDARTGEAYVAFAARLHGSAPADILVASTKDHGLTWIAAVRATHGRPSPERYLFQPQIAVDASSGVDVSFFALLRGLVNLYLTRSAVPTPDLAFGPTRRVNSHPFNPNRGLSHSKHGLWWIGDYQGLATVGNSAHPLWNDTRTGQLQIFTASVPLSAKW